MFVLTYDKLNGMPTADGKAKALIADAIARHTKGVKDDSKYSLCLTTSSFCVVLALFQAVINGDLSRRYLQLQYKAAAGVTPMDIENIEAGLDADGDEEEGVEDIIIAFTSDSAPTVELEIGGDIDLDDLADVIL